MYKFDNVFTDEPIESVYQQTAQGLIPPMFKGFNGCVFAYGATGTGKTFTMLGGQQSKGLIQLSLEELFRMKAEFDPE